MSETKGAWRSPERPAQLTRVGRFAPSPTGPLHFGSLVAAVGSYLDARTSGGVWHLRIEDVDRPRTVTGMVDAQMTALQAYGFEWESPVLRQSDRTAVYQTALNALIENGDAYPCHCTRRQLADQHGVHRGVDGLVYPGRCAGWSIGDPIPPGAAWRFRVPGGITGFDDRVYGLVSQDLVRDVGDFPLRRADGCFTYQLAVVVDDLAQGITDVVRGADLIDSTPRQIALIRALGGSVPIYAHLPVVRNAAGEKLSKQTCAVPIPLGDEAIRVDFLWQALTFLGQQPPAGLRHSSQQTLWVWAMAHWRLGQIAAQ